MLLDTQALTETINLCFAYARDGRLSPSKRNEMLVLGKRLRGSLVNLLSAEFEEGTAEVETANRNIKAVNKRLVETQQNLDETVQLANDLATLASTLDGLLKAARSFV